MGLLEVWSGQYAVAKSARNYIDAENIISDANKIKSQLEELSFLSSNIEKVCSDLNGEALSVDGKDMSGNVSFAIEYILNEKNTQISFLDETIQRAEDLYNQYQEDLNNQAKYENERKKAEIEKTGSN